MKFSGSKTRGFTLIELITVIIILGILASSVTQFLRYGAKSYTDATDREALISTARFVIERLNREVRSALPNSIRVTSDANLQCLEYTPIAKSVIYLNIAVAPEPASNTIEFMMMNQALPSSVNSLAVYALNSNDVYNRRVGVVASFSGINLSTDETLPSSVTLISNTQFLAESPTNRLYFIESPIAYCLSGSSLYRYENYNYTSNNTPIFDGTNRYLMAEYLSNDISQSDQLPFKTVPATLQRNGLALVRFIFSRNLEEIVFNNEIQVPNVP